MFPINTTPILPPPPAVWCVICHIFECGSITGHRNSAEFTFVVTLFIESMSIINDLFFSSKRLSHMTDAAEAKVGT